MEGFMRISPWKKSPKNEGFMMIFQPARLWRSLTIYVFGLQGVLHFDPCHSMVVNMIPENITTPKDMKKTWGRAEPPLTEDENQLKTNPKSYQTLGTTWIKSSQVPISFQQNWVCFFFQTKTPDTFSIYGAEHGSSLIHTQGSSKNNNGFQWYGFGQKPSVLPFTLGVWPGIVPFNSMRFCGGSPLDLFFSISSCFLT